MWTLRAQVYLRLSFLQDCAHSVTVVARTHICLLWPLKNSFPVVLSGIKCWDSQLSPAQFNPWRWCVWMIIWLSKPHIKSHIYIIVHVIKLSGLSSQQVMWKVHSRLVLFSVSVCLCFHTYHMCNIYVKYIFVMRLYFGWLDDCLEYWCI